MSENVFQPAIDALEEKLADLERQANDYLMTINFLREKAGLPLAGRRSGQITQTVLPTGKALEITGCLTGANPIIPCEHGGVIDWEKVAG